MVYQSRGETFSTADKELQLGNNNFTVFFDFNPFTRGCVSYSKNQKALNGVTSLGWTGPSSAPTGGYFNTG